MKTPGSNAAWKVRSWWFLIVAAALLVWTTYWHWCWLMPEPSMHGLLAFFAGLLLLILGQGIVRLGIGAFRQGGRWLVGIDAIRVCGWTVLFSVSVVLLFYSIESWRGKRAWAQVVKVAELQGASLELTEIIPQPVPDAQNFARAPIFSPLLQVELPSRDAPVESAKGATSQLAMVARWDTQSLWHEGLRQAPWLHQESTDFHQWLDFAQGETHGSMARTTGNGLQGSITSLNRLQAAERVVETLEEFSPALEELKTYSDRPYCRFPLDYRRQFWMQNQSLSVLHGFTRILRVHASARLALGQTDEAFHDVQLALRLLDYSCQQPWVMTTGLRYSVLIDALQPIWEGLETRQWSDEQLKAVQGQLEALNLLDGCRAAIEIDAFAMADFCESVVPTSRQSRSLPIQEGIGTDEDRVLRWVRWTYPTGWSLQDQAAIHQQGLRLRFLFEDGAPAWLAFDEQPWQDILGRSSDPFFPVFVVPRVVEMVHDTRWYYIAQTAVDQAGVACALERHCIAQGQYAAALDALVPRFANTIPSDVINGKPLNYRRLQEDRFVLYSVGFNGTDDGGKPSPRQTDWQGRSEPTPDPGKFDRVWTYPVERAPQ